MVVNEARHFRYKWKMMDKSEKCHVAINGEVEKIGHHDKGLNFCFIG